MHYYGGIEAGGTKFVCAVADENGAIKSDIQFPTTTPEETLQRSIAFFKDQPDPVEAIGIGTFGPVDPEPGSPTYGYITSTPKPGWQNTDFAGQIQAALGVPIGFDTDVNAAALGEHRWGAARDVDTFVYLTIGTGIGGGGMVRGKLLHGLMHPEMGHIRIPHDLDEDPFPGACPFHGDCLEGLAAGPAIEARWGQRGETPPAGPSGLVTGGLLSRLWPGLLYLRPLPSTDHPRRWDNRSARPPGDGPRKYPYPA